MNFLRDVVVPLAVLTTVIGLSIVTFKLFAMGAVGGAICTTILTAAFGYFVFYDVRRLLSKI